MQKLSPLSCLFACLWLSVCLSACNDANAPLINKQPAGAYATQIRQQIAVGKKAESVNNDSLNIISKRLYGLNKLSGDRTALVYAELFETNYYWQAADHKKAMDLAIKCLADAERYNVRPALSQIYGTIANLHKETTNYAMAFMAADSGLALAEKDKDTAQIIALLGLKAMFTRGVSLNNHRPGSDKSIDLNLAALKIAESSPKYERLRIRFYDNICQYYKDQGDYEKAFYYGNKGVELATKYNQQRSLTYAYCWLGQATYFKGDKAKGIALLSKALQISIALKEPYRTMEIHGHMYDCYISTKDYKYALTHYTKMRTLRDSLKVLDNVKQISELQLKYEAVQKDKKISVLSAKTQLEAVQRNSIIIVLMLLIVISMLVYIKERKRKELILKEKLLVDEELKNAALELLYFTDNLKQKNEVIEEFKAEIEHLHLKSITTADAESLENLINAHIMTDENWDSFKKLFTKVHTGFFNGLKQLYPNLTATDVRMLSLIKLQLSNYEMANMLGITIEGIKKSKQRLRKKMDLDRDSTIENVVFTL